MPDLSIFLSASVLLNSILLISGIFLWRKQAASQAKAGQLQQAWEQASSERAFFQGQLAELEHLKQQLGEKEQQCEQLREHQSHRMAELASIKAQAEQRALADEEKLQLLKESRQQLALEFEQLANKLLETKTVQFKEQQNQFFAQTMTPLKEQLTEFRQRLDSVHATDSKDRLQLLNEIANLRNLNQQMAEEAINLTNALKGNQKFQGNWGEFVLERVLEDSGLRKGYEYELQAKRYDQEGRLKLPDVVVHLPDSKDLIIDAKVSLNAYQAYCESTEAESKAQALKAHLRSMEQHIKGLSIKDYEQLSGVNTLDFVFMFVPVEAAFLLALESDPALFQLAYDKHIILVSPTTLLATLRTVENLWRYERQNKNAEKIAQQAGGLYDQCVLVAESLEEVGKCIERSHAAYDTTIKRLASGKGNVLKRIDTLKQLGAKTKKSMPEQIVDDFHSLDAPADTDTDDTEE